MKPKAPRISVVMPVYNAEKYLSPAIESILKQSFKDFEFIIIDDASQDRSGKIIWEYAAGDDRIIVRRNDKNMKLSRTLNRGIELSRGEYIARMDADDIALIDRLEKQAAYMDKNITVGISGGTMNIINAPGKTIGIRRYHTSDASIRRHIFRYSPFSHPTVMIRKAVLQKAGLYNPDFNPAEDYELYFRIGVYSRFGNLPDSLIYYRIVPKSMTTGFTRAMELKTLAIRKKAVQDYGYRMTLGDTIYLIMQYISVYIIPYSIKIWLFTRFSSWRR